MAKSINFKENNYVNGTTENIERVRVEINRYKPLSYEDTIDLIEKAHNGKWLVTRLLRQICASCGLSLPLTAQ